MRINYCSSLCIADGDKPKKGRAKKSDHSSTTESTISTTAIQNIVQKLKTQRVRDSTKKNYYSVWKNFNEFFIRLDMKPASWEERLVLFIGYLIEKKNFKSQSVKSYISAIRGVLHDDGIELNDNKFLLSALTRACKLKNDKVRTRLPIRKEMLGTILRCTYNHFQEKNQNYLAQLYCALFSTAYFGMFRVGEVTTGDHPIMAFDVILMCQKHTAKGVHHR